MYVRYLALYLPAAAAADKELSASDSSALAAAEYAAVAVVISAGDTGAISSIESASWARAISVSDTAILADESYATAEIGQAYVVSDAAALSAVESAVIEKTQLIDQWAPAPVAGAEWGDTYERRNG